MIGLPETLTIARLGARGDGVALREGAPVHVGYALPGEVVRVAVQGERGRLIAVDTPSPERREPVCPLFGRCGGCAVQHLAEEPYRAWKRDLVVTAVARAGLEAPVGPLIDAHGEGRRRVVLHVRRVAGAIRAGFMMARSHDLVPVAACPVLAPGLATASAMAEALAAIVGLAKPLDVQVTASEAGLDIDLRGCGPVREGARLALARAAETHDLARVSVHGDLVIERRAPQVRMGPAMVMPAPGGFLQATAQGEAELAQRVLAGTEGAGRIADLFSGAGPFALRLAPRSEVAAFDSDAGAIAALDRAWRGTPGLKSIRAEARDLFRRPLLAPELDGFDAVVLDPPRAGAEMQARQIAASHLARVVMVACDATSFARDAKILVDAGFTMGEVTPIDQFRYSPHVELACAFTRERSGKGRRS